MHPQMPTTPTCLERCWDTPFHQFTRQHNQPDESQQVDHHTKCPHTFFLSPTDALSDKKTTERPLCFYFTPLVTEACPGTACRLRSVPGNPAHCCRDPLPLHPQASGQARDSNS